MRPASPCHTVGTRLAELMATRVRREVPGVNATARHAAVVVEFAFHNVDDGPAEILLPGACFEPVRQDPVGTVELERPRVLLPLMVSGERPPVIVSGIGVTAEEREIQLVTCRRDLRGAVLDALQFGAEVLRTRGAGYDGSDVPAMLALSAMAQEIESWGDWTVERESARCLTFARATERGITRPRPRAMGSLDVERRVINGSDAHVFCARVTHGRRGGTLDRPVKHVDVLEARYGDEHNVAHFWDAFKRSLMDACNPHPTREVYPQATRHVIIGGAAS